MKIDSVSVYEQIFRRTGATLLAGILLLIFLTVPVTADNYVGGIPLDTAEEGTVSGGVWIDSYYGMSGASPVTVEQQYHLPDYTAVRWARLYVCVYCGHMENNLAGTATVEFNGGNGYSQIGSESLNVPYTFPGKDYNPPSGEYGTGPATVNDHCVRVTSDYLMWYDVTSSITGRDVLARVSTAYNDQQFDGRIKIVTLVVAYDDGDGDSVRYWVMDGHDTDSYQSDDILGENYFIRTTFPTGELPPEEEWADARLQVAHLASEDATYTLNDDEPTDLITSGKGNYCGYNAWDVAGIVTPWEDTTLSCDRTDSFYKIFLATLSVRYPEKETGTLTVTSSPPGATLLIDGEETEYTTNCTIPGLPVGSYAVSVEHAQYEEAEEQWVDIAADEETPVHFSLLPLTGSISVTSDPSGAKVFIDGEDSGLTTDALLEDVIIGDHTVSVRLTGHRDASNTVCVSEDETSEVSFILTPESGQEGGGGESSGDDGDTENTGYTGKELTSSNPITFRGDVVTIPFGTYTGLIESDATSQFTWNVPLKIDEEPVLARLFLYTTWGHNTNDKSGTEVHLKSALDNAQITPDATYTDRKGEGAYDYILSTVCFNVTGAIQKNGNRDYELAVTNNGNPGDVCALYGGTLVILCKNESAPLRTVWLNEGCDAIIADEAAGITSDDATTVFPFPGIINTDGVKTANLTIISTAATGKGDDAHRIFFNDWEYYNVLTGGSSGISMWTESVENFLRTKANTARVQSALTGAIGDYLENRNALLVITHTTTSLDASVVTQPKESKDPETSGGITADTESFTLSVSGDRLRAAELKTKDGRCRLYIREGTLLLDRDGSPVRTITIQQINGPPGANTEWTYTISPATATADIPLILEISGGIDRQGDEIMLSRYDTDSGGWEDTGYVPIENGAAMSGITRLGTYSAIGTSEASVEEGTGGILSGVTNFLYDILRFTGLSEVLNISPTADTQEEEVHIPNVASNSPERSPVEIQEPNETLIDYKNGTYDLTVLSNPPGALVMLDGFYTGKTTPCVLTDTRGGSHTLSVSRNGFREAGQKLTITDDNEIRFDISPESSKLNKLKFDGYVPNGYNDGIGGVYVTSYPDGAQIYLDGRNTDLTTPEVIVGLKKGRHTIKVRSEQAEYPCDIKSVWVYPGSITGVTFDHAYITTHIIDFSSDFYQGADFTVNGKYPSYTFPKEVGITGIDPYVTLRQNGSYISQSGSLWRDGDAICIGPEEMTFGTVHVTSEPQGAEIFVDGFPTGLHTPYLIDNISEGLHTFSVSLPGHLPDEEVLHLIPVNRPIDAELSFLLEPYTYGSLSISSEPEGAKIYLYNKYSGMKTPAVFRYMDIGSVPVRLVSAEGTANVENAVVSPFETAEFHIVLTPDE